MEASSAATCNKRQAMPQNSVISHAFVANSQLATCNWHK